MESVVNPKTKRKVLTKSNKGASIIAGYLSRLHQKDQQEKQVNKMTITKKERHTILSGN